MIVDTASPTSLLRLGPYDRIQQMTGHCGTSSRGATPVYRGDAHGRESLPQTL